MEDRDLEFEYYVNSFCVQLVGRYGFDRVMSSVEHAMCRIAMDKAKTNQDAANILKMNRTRLQNMLKMYGIRRKDLDPNPPKKRQVEQHQAD
jgi:DNA-binding protein Fis